MENIKLKKITSEELINKKSTIRCTAKNMANWFDTEEAMQDNNYRHCSVCGFYYHVSDGAGECAEVHVLDNICNDCIELLKEKAKEGLTETDIMYCYDDYDDYIEERVY